MYSRSAMDIALIAFLSPIRTHAEREAQLTVHQQEVTVH
jgi:hypothetical protein